MNAYIKRVRKKNLISEASVCSSKVHSRKSVLIAASVASMIDQFNMPNIELLMGLGFDVDVAANFINGSTCTDKKIRELIERLDKLGADCYQIDFSREVTNFRAIITAFRQLDDLMSGKSVPINGTGHHRAGCDRKYAFVHLHSPIAGAIGRITAGKYGIKTIYTAHGFHFYHGSPKKNWLIFYPAEWGLGWITDVLITINREDYRRAKREFHAKKTVYVPGVGIDTEKFSSGLVDSEEKRKELGVSPDAILILSAGELIPRKNHETVIRALAQIQNADVQYYIAGKGVLEQTLKTLVQDLNLSDQVHFLGFRTDVSELCQAADLFIFPSQQEKLPLELMEAVACRTPVVCSNIRGNTGFITDRAYLFDQNCLDDVAGVLKRLLVSRDEIRTAASAAVKHNRDLLKACDLKAADKKMKHLSEGLGSPLYKRLNALMIRKNLDEQYGMDDGDIVLLSVGELNENKNHKVVIEALGLMRERSRHLHYFIAGRGKLHHELARLAKKLGVNLHLLGFRSDVPDLLKAADIFILPSVREGLNVSLMEAMSSGLPCIAGDIRGNRDLFREHESRYLVNSQNPCEFAKAIEKLERIISNQSYRADYSVIKEIDKRTVDKLMKKIYRNTGNRNSRVRAAEYNGD